MYPPNKQTHSSLFFCKWQGCSTEKAPSMVNADVSCPRPWMEAERSGRLGGLAAGGIHVSPPFTLLILPATELHGPDFRAERDRRLGWAQSPQRMALSLLLHTLPWRRGKSWPRTWHFSTSSLSSCGALGLWALAPSAVEGGWWDVSLGDSGAVITQAPGTANAWRAPLTAADAVGLSAQGCALAPAEAGSAPPLLLRKIVIRAECWLG